MSYNKMKIAVGIFILTFFVTSSAFLYFILKEKGTFDKRYSYNFTTDSANSFIVGMPLKFSGFKIGVIDKISLNDNGSVSMKFSVNGDNKKWISEDSVLLVRKPLIGSAHIEVYPVLGNPPLKAGSSLLLIMSDDINDMISKLEPAIDKIINIINNIDSLTTKLSSDDSHLLNTLKNINIFTKKLSSDDSLLTTITGNTSAGKSVVESLNTMKKIIEEIHKVSSLIDSDIMNPASSTIKELDMIMKDVKQKLDAIDGTVKVIGDSGNDLVELKEQISVGVIKSNQIIDKIDGLIQNENESKVVLP